MKRAHVSLALLAVITLALAGCGGGGGGGGGAGGITVSLSPTGATIRPSSTVVLTAAVSGTANTAVVWTKSAGNLMVLNNVGTYTAPATEGTYTVTATSLVDATRRATASIVVSNSAPVDNISVTIAPDNIELSPGDFIDLTATVTGSSNLAVTWSTNGGSIAITGNHTARYTAPATEATYTVTATSVADTSKSDSIQILVTTESPPPPPPI